MRRSCPSNLETTLKRVAGVSPAHKKASAKGRNRKAALKGKDNIAQGEATEGSRNP
jgi:hypothetical protein